MLRLSAFFTAMVLSELGERPLLRHPGSVLRLTVQPSFGPYWSARILQGGTIVGKFIRDRPHREAEVPRPASDLSEDLTDNSLSLLDPFFYELEDDSHVGTCEVKSTQQIDVCAAGLIESLASPGFFVPDVCQLDGVSIMLEVGPAGRFFEIKPDHQYEDPVCAVLQRLSQLVEYHVCAHIPQLSIRPSFLAEIQPEVLDTWLSQELPSVIALILAFVPAENMQLYVEKYRPREAELIKKAAASIDCRDHLNVDLFYEIERVLLRKVS